MRYGTKWLIAILAALATVAVLVPAIGMGALGMGGLGSGMMGQGIGSCPMGGSTMPGGMMAGCPMGGAGMMTDTGWSRALFVGLNGLGTLALIGAAIVAVALATRWLTDRDATPADDPQTILRRRYASGEIDSLTYAEMRAALNA